MNTRGAVDAPPPDGAGTRPAGEHEALCDALLADLRREFPRFRIVDKRGHALSRAIDLFLKAITFGGQRAYLTRYHTVLGYTLHVPDAWARTPPLERVIILRHERVHLRQRRRWGALGMAAIYLLPFFPLGLAYGRARIEMEAYEETVRATWELVGPIRARSATLRAHVVSQFTSAAYGWMWPFKRAIERWYDGVLARLAR